MKSPRLLALFVGGIIGFSPGLASAYIFQEGLYSYSGTYDTELREHQYATATFPGHSHTGTETFGHLPSMTVDGDDHSGVYDDVQVLLKFDNIIGTGINQIPEGTKHWATLTLYLEDRGNSINMLKMLGDWGADATWGDYGADGITVGTDATYLRTIEGRPISGSPLSKSGKFIKIDVTDEVQSWIDNPLSNFGWAFTPTGDNGVDFATSETLLGSMYAPKLYVGVVSEPGTLAIFGLGLAGLGYIRRRRVF